MIPCVSGPVHHIVVNGESRPHVEGESVAALLDRLGLAGVPCAVELNRAVVPRKRHAETTLSPEDRLEVVTLVGGG